MIAGRVGDGVNGARLFPGRLHTCDGGLVRFLVAGAGVAHLTVGKASAAPGGLAVLGRHRWTLGHVPHDVALQLGCETWTAAIHRAYPFPPATLPSRPAYFRSRKRRYSVISSQSRGTAPAVYYQLL